MSSLPPAESQYLSDSGLITVGGRKKKNNPTPPHGSLHRQSHIVYTFKKLNIMGFCLLESI